MFLKTELHTKFLWVILNRIVRGSMDDKDAYIEVIIEELKECADVELLDLIYQLLNKK